MNQTLIDSITLLLTDKHNTATVYFAGNQLPPPELAYQVDFPRLEFVIDGEQSMQWDSQQGNYLEQLMRPGDALFVPAKGWNLPRWDQPVTTLSVLFGKQQLGLSLLHWDGESFHALAQDSVARRGPRVGAFMLQALNELAWHQEDQATARYLVRGLLSNVLNLFHSLIQTQSRSKTLFEVIRNYLDVHYREALTRESVAMAFYISPNYLSHLFQKEGCVGFNEYLNHVRLENAKNLLKQHDMKVKEVAHQCGFVDSNYFCRVFRKHTERSPSEYRRQYLSQFDVKNHHG